MSRVKQPDALPPNQRLYQDHKILDFKKQFIKNGPVGISRAIPQGDVWEYPLRLTRIPLFSVNPRSRHGAYSVNEPREIETSWGRLKTIGDVLSPYDQETLFGITRLCDKEYEIPIGSTGSPKLATIDGKKVTQDDLEWWEPTRILKAEVNVYELNDLLGRSTDGKSARMTSDSIRKLATANLQLNYEREVMWDVELSKLLHKDEDVLMKGTDSEGEALWSSREYMEQILWYNAVHESSENEILSKFNVTLTPFYTSLLLENATLVDKSVRRQLKQHHVAKVLHVFLSSQLSKKKTQYQIRLSLLKTTLGFEGENKEFRRKLDQANSRLVDVGYLSDAAIAMSKQHKESKAIFDRVLKKK